MSDADVLAIDQAVQVLSRGPQRLVANSDAYAFLTRVKERFQDDVDTYKNFLNIFKEFKAQRIDTRGVVSEVKELFIEHRDLLLQFSAFLPPKHRSKIITEDEGQALRYLNEVKVSSNDDVFKAFLNILMKFRKQIISLSGACDEVHLLFQDHPHLLDGFNHFIPFHEDCAQHSRNHIHPDEAKNLPFHECVPSIISIVGFSDVTSDEYMEEEGDETESEWVVISLILEEMTL